MKVDFSSHAGAFRDFKWRMDDIAKELAPWRVMRFRRRLIRGAGQFL